MTAGASLLDLIGERTSAERAPAVRAFAQAFLRRLSPDGSFGSGTLESGASFSHEFTKAGVFAYRCEIHPEMKGKVTVQ